MEFEGEEGCVREERKEVEERRRDARVGRLEDEEEEGPDSN